MSVKISLEQVVGAGHLRCWVSKQATSFIPEMMDIYTGWILLGYDNTSSVLVRDSFDSFVPLGHAAKHLLVSQEMIESAARAVLGR